MSTGTVVHVEVAPPAEPPSWLPASVRREVRAVHRWLADAQHALARLPGAEPRHHRQIRAIAAELRADLLRPWGVE
jgi:hypothetical protein